MTEENQNILTKKDIMDVLVEFNKETLRPQMEEVMEDVMMDGLANFNIDYLVPMEERLDAKIEKTSGNLMSENRKTRDYADKRINEAKGEIIEAVNTKTQKIINILDRNKLMNKTEKEGLAVMVS